MPGGARRSLASPVVSGVLCQCGGVGAGATTAASPSGPVPVAAAAASTAVASEGSFGGGSSSSSSLVEHERRLQSLFLQLDVNRDGALCVHDLAVGLERLGLHRSERDLWSLSLVFSCISCLDSGI